MWRTDTQVLPTGLALLVLHEPIHLTAYLMRRLLVLLALTIQIMHRPARLEHRRRGRVLRRRRPRLARARTRVRAPQRRRRRARAERRERERFRCGRGGRSVLLARLGWAAETEAYGVPERPYRRGFGAEPCEEACGLAWRRCAECERRGRGG